MAIPRFFTTGVAVIAAANIGGTAEHMALYSYVGGRYIADRIFDNRGQANLNFDLAFQTICSGLGNTGNDPKNQRDNQTPCHAACANRPERKVLQGDDEPEPA